MTVVLQSTASHPITCRFLIIGIGFTEVVPSKEIA
jgi:hypothetical protein